MWQDEDGIVIEKLTLEQEKALSVYRDEMRSRGLRLQWAGEDEIRDVVVNLYEAAGQARPSVFVLDSPLACLMARQGLKNVNKEGQLWDQLDDQIRLQLRDQLSVQLRDQLRVQLADQLADQLWAQLWAQLGVQLRVQLADQLGVQLADQLGEQLGEQLGGQLWDQLWAQLVDQLRDQLRDQLWGQLRSQLRSQLGVQLRSQLVDQLRNQIDGQLRGRDGVEYQSLFFAGGSENYWISFYDFARSIGVRYDAGHLRWLEAWKRYAEVAGCLYPYDGVAFVSRRPTVLRLDDQQHDQQQLHCETGPAMFFLDGFEIYAWHGTRVPGDWINNPGSTDPAEVIKVENVEQRAAGCAILGWSRMADRLSRKVIEGDPDSDIGALIELTLPGLPEPGRFLMAQCPRNGTICEGVPRVSDIDGLPIETAIAAQAWRDCLPQAEYNHPTIRT